MKATVAVRGVVTRRVGSVKVTVKSSAVRVVMLAGNVTAVSTVALSNGASVGKVSVAGVMATPPTASTPSPARA